MNKAVIGMFRDNAAAMRGINALKAQGFAGETIAQHLRDPAGREYAREGMVTPGMEILKGIIIGAIVGAILGAIANLVFGLTMTWLTFGAVNALWDAIITMAVVGAVGGLFEGFAAVGPLNSARRVLSQRGLADAVVSVQTDEGHANRAAELLREAGAFDVRRGASSTHEEFRTDRVVQPETYGGERVDREPVEPPLQPAARNDVVVRERPADETSGPA